MAKSIEQLKKEIKDKIFPNKKGLVTATIIHDIFTDIVDFMSSFQLREKGEKGDPGIQGVPGPQGPQGPQGQNADIQIIDGYWYINGANSGQKATEGSVNNLSFGDVNINTSNAVIKYGTNGIKIASDGIYFLYEGDWAKADIKTMLGYHPEGGGQEEPDPVTPIPSIDIVGVINEMHINNASQYWRTLAEEHQIIKESDALMCAPIR